MAREHEDVQGDQARGPTITSRDTRIARGLAGIGGSRILVATTVVASTMLRHHGQLDASIVKAEIVIKLDHVSKTYGNDVTALDDVSVEVGKGEFVFVVGQSGSGKSTFLRLLTKEERPTTGKIWVAGKELNRLASWKVPALRAPSAACWDFKLSNKTVRENVAFALEVIGARRHAIERTVPRC